MSTQKRLYRSRKDIVISGVCGGIAQFFNIDPVLVRVLWAVVAFGSAGNGILIYIIAAIVIPKEPLTIKTSTQQPISNSPDDLGEQPEYSTVDNTEQSHKTYSNHSPVEKSNNGTFGMILGLIFVTLGVTILAANLFDFNLNFIWTLNFNYIRMFAKYFWPICLILLGLVFFVKSKN